ADIKVVAERIQTGKCNVASTAHKRNDIHAESLKHHGNGKQEDHRAAVHGEHLVVEIGAHQGILWPDELKPDHRRQHAAKKKKRKTGDHETDTDIGVMSVAEPSPQTRRLTPGVSETLSKFRLPGVLIIGEDGFCNCQDSAPQ